MDFSNDTNMTSYKTKLQVRIFYDEFIKKLKRYSLTLKVQIDGAGAVEVISVSSVTAVMGTHSPGSLCLRQQHLSQRHQVTGWVIWLTTVIWLKLHSVTYIKVVFV
jgi:hypothetical protein